MRTPQKNTKNTGTNNRIKALFVAAAVTAGLGLGACGTGAVEVDEVTGGAATEAPVQADSASTNEAAGASKAKEAPADDEISYEATETVILTNPAGAEAEYSNDDIATIPEDELLGYDDSAGDANNIEDPRGDQPMGEPQFVRNEFFGFSYSLDNGFDLTNAELAAMGLEHHNKWIDTTVRVFGEFETLDLGDYMGEVALYNADGSNGRSVSTYMSVPQRLDNGNLLIRSSIDVGSHVVIMEIEGPDNMAWDTHQSVDLSLAVLDQVPMDSPA